MIFKLYAYFFQDGAIANGDNFQKTVRKCYDSNPQQLVAVGINCLGPKYVEPLIKGLNKGRENRPIPIIVYPNSGENYNPESGYVPNLTNKLLLNNIKDNFFYFQLD